MIKKKSASTQKELALELGFRILISDLLVATTNHCGSLDLDLTLKIYNI